MPKELDDEKGFSVNSMSQNERILSTETEELKSDEDNSEDSSEDGGDKDDGSMSILAHLEELRWRLIRSIIAVIVCSGICYYFIEDIMAFISQPVGKLYYLQPSEAFFTYLKVSICCGFILALPIVFYQLWCFVLPALTIKERYIAAVIVPSSVILFLSGLAFFFCSVRAWRAASCAFFSDFL